MNCVNRDMRAIGTTKDDVHGRSGWKRIVSATAKLHRHNIFRPSKCAAIWRIIVVHDARHPPRMQFDITSVNVVHSLSKVDGWKQLSMVLWHYVLSK